MVYGKGRWKKESLLMASFVFLYGVNRGDGEKTTIVRGFSRENRGVLLTLRFELSKGSQIRFSAASWISGTYTTTATK